MRTIRDVMKSEKTYYQVNQPEPVPMTRSGVGGCFGCSPSNDFGLQLQFTQYGDGTIEARHQTAQHHCGFDTVIHGGIQATLLDEVMGVAAQRSLPSDGSDLACATAEMHLEYLRPAFLANEVICRAWVTEIDGRDIYAEGALLSADAAPSTKATSRWRQMRYEPT